jgi:hypothetical protein
MGRLSWIQLALVVVLVRKWKSRKRRRRYGYLRETVGNQSSKNADAFGGVDYQSIVHDDECEEVRTPRPTVTNGSEGELAALGIPAAWRCWPLFAVSLRASPQPQPHVRETFVASLYSLRTVGL